MMSAMTTTAGQPPRVAILTSVHDPFDTRVFYRQATSLRAAGFEVLLIAPGTPREPINGVNFESLPTIGGRLGRPLRWPVLLWKALRSDADIYHFHDPELLPCGLLLKWVTRKPVIYDSHEYLRESILSKHWIPGVVRSAVSRAAGWTETFVAARLDAVVSVTEDMTERFRQSQPCAITVRNFPPAPDESARSTAGEPVVIYAGLMNIERGLDLLFETASLVRERLPAAEFHIYGPVEWFGIPQGGRHSPAEWDAAGVRFMGRIPQPEIEERLERASVAWLPLDPTVPNSVRAWPTKLVEYMRVGLPVVASDLAIQGSVIRRENCGTVVPHGSPAAHADAICALLEAPAEARRLGENGRRAAVEKYTWEGEAARLESLYRQLLAGHSRA